ncbi:epocide hydrolase domain-containing protein [Zopfochytrium polystomum]|nr:epocide hydrolase domain-containing protein [Zopfochytrium polystomum]
MTTPAASASAAAARPFAVAVPDAALDDLRERLAAARVPDPLVAPVAVDERGNRMRTKPHLQGIPHETLVALVDRWRALDWRAQEAKLNALPHFSATVRDGLDLHFLHRRSKRPDAVPILLLHGWPGSFYEFHKVVDDLADPPGDEHAPAFHVVVPSLPGFAFSAKPTRRGFKASDMAAAFADLMTDVLGYPRFLVQGGDWGSAVARRIAVEHPGRCFAVHLNLAYASPPPLRPATLRHRLLLAVAPRRALSGDERAALRAARAADREESGYYHIQRTKPYTLGVALNDSPVGLLAWIADKMWPALRFRELSVGFWFFYLMDDMLTIVSIYWFTESIASSFRLYKEDAGLGSNAAALPVFNAYIKQPVAVAVFPREISRPPELWLRENQNLVRYTKMKEGGHFPALEVPRLLVEDLRAFAAQLGVGGAPAGGGRRGGGAGGGGGVAARL